MKLNQIHTIYFIGIGGIGMSNLAFYLKHLGKHVWGYDKTPSPITKSLQDKGIVVNFDIDLQRLKTTDLNKSDSLIVYTPAIKRHEHEELDYLINEGYKVVKRAELLGIVTRSSISLAVAGTHGKTTTSALLGHILYEADVPATSFIGGIAENYKSNLIIKGSQYTVVEADEYDRSFLQLQPDYACITATDADHLDIYETESAFIEGFEAFRNQVKRKVFVHHNCSISGLTFGFTTTNDYAALNINIQDGVYHFDLKTPTDFHHDLAITLPGKHNILNTLGAISLANSIGVSITNIKRALLTFKGIARRFTFRIKSKDLVLIDDYAHHPTELKALFNTVKELYPDEPLSIYFQPHTYTRTRDFMDGFSEVLAQFDKVNLLPIYAAREHPIEGITSEILVQKIKQKQSDTQLVKPEDLLEHIKKNKCRITVMAGAGDIGEMIINATKQLTKNNE